MSITSTTLSAACALSDTTLKLTATTGFPAVGSVGQNQIVKIDDEYMICTGVPVSGTITVRSRGSEGTVAKAHDILAIVQTSSAASDFPPTPTGSANVQPPFGDDVVTLGADTTFVAAGTAASSGTQPLPTKNTTYIITKASASAITMITASAAQVGVRMTFVSGTANAHVITYTPGVYGDTTSSDLLTFAAKVGASCVLVVGYTGLIGAYALTNVTAG